MLLLANARCLKKRRKQKQQICFEWRIFFKNNNKFREENVFKTYEKREK